MLRALSAVLLLGLYPLSAHAEMASPPPAHAPQGLLVAAELSAEELDAISAGQNIQVVALTEQNLKAVNSGNSITADTVRSGDVAFSSGAFSGFNGVGNFVVNTGNNNNLQGSLSVTVIAAP